MLPVLLPAPLFHLPLMGRKQCFRGGISGQAANGLTVNSVKNGRFGEAWGGHGECFPGVWGS